MRGDRSARPLLQVADSQLSGGAHLIPLRYYSMTGPKNMLVLIVDDEPLIRQVASDVLEEEGFDVVEAADAEEALSVLRARNDVGVLFTDVNMPRALDGLDLAELVNERWPAINLVITSERELPRAVPDHGRFIPKRCALG
jgi:two-component system, response regulator PdtaR